MASSDETALQALSVHRRREIFSELVSCQDAGISVDDSRSQLATYYEISIEMVKRIETLGISQNWPPL